MLPAAGREYITRARTPSRPGWHGPGALPRLRGPLALPGEGWGIAPTGVRSWATIGRMEPLRRSLLYVPASSETMVRKAGTRGADVLILDLEDGVVPEAKDAARRDLPDLCSGVDFGTSEVLVRVNAPGTQWYERDLDMVRSVRPAGVVLPKAREAEEIRLVDEALGKTTPLYLMLETVDGVLEARVLASASPRVAGLLFGAADYRESLRAGRLPGEAELAFARSQIVHAARAAGAEAFDTPWFEITDLHGLEASARLARGLGFDGKAAIHPAQVSAINAAFAPTREEVARARAIVEALARAREGGRPVAVVGGEMVEALHLREARRTLGRAERLGSKGPGPAR
jgi:citrate lyase subunit beta / citryl-CoA lyase